MPGPVLTLILALGAVAAPGVSFAPEIVELSAAHPYADLTVRNVGGTAREVRTGVLSWTQDETGAVVLDETATADVFPRAAILRPGDERRFRIWSREPAPALERAYRVAVHVRELAGAAAVTALVPAFFAPARARTAAAVRIACASRTCRVVVENGGTVRFRPQRLAIALVADGITTSGRELEPWWVLAGGARAYDLPLEAGATVREVIARLELDGEALTASAPVDP